MGNIIPQPSRLVGWLFALAALIASGHAPAFAQHNTDLGDPAASAAAILVKEIARDEEILSAPMNMARLRQTREKLGRDLPEKQKVIAGLKDMGASGSLAEALKVLEETYAAEKMVFDDIRISDPAQIRAARALREGLPRKKEALRAL
ncbi:MAG: hypothetical protein HY751_11120 [Nitrospinae bacterium]|nr:hypothetical protein [Nitrospinota bacterium]